MMVRFGVLLLGWLAAISVAVAQPADPLTSWNDGATKRAITDFVARVFGLSITLSRRQMESSMKRAFFAALAFYYVIGCAQAQTFAADDLGNRTIHRRAVEAVIWGMPAVNFELHVPGDGSRPRAH